MNKNNEDLFDLSQKQMDSLLVDMLNTRYWVAIKKYCEIGLSSINSTLSSVDPFKEPTLCARAQGSKMALNEFERYIYSIKERMEKEAENNENK